LADNIKDVTHEILRDIQARLGRLEGDMASVKADTHEIKARMATAEHLLMALITSIPTYTDRFERLENRLISLEEWRKNFDSSSF
jgi:uncharacterized protein (UPF0335 family)